MDDIGLEEAVARQTAEAAAGRYNGLEDLLEEVEGTTPVDRLQYAITLIGSAESLLAAAEEELRSEVPDSGELLRLMVQAKNKIITLFQTMCADPAQWAAVIEWSGKPTNPEAANFYSPVTYWYFAMRQIHLATILIAGSFGPDMNFNERIKMFMRVKPIISQIELVLTRTDIHFPQVPESNFEDTDAALDPDASAEEATPDPGASAEEKEEEGIDLFEAYQQTGELPLLVKGVGFFRAAASVARADDPDRGRYLTNLGVALHALYERTGHRAALGGKLVQACRDAVAAASPDKSSSRVVELNALANALRSLAELTADVAMLTEAAQLGRDAVTATTADDPRHAAVLSNLGITPSVAVRTDGGYVAIRN